MSANLSSDGLWMTKSEYLDFLHDSEIKYEYFNGEVIAMAGAKPNHNHLTMSLSYLIYGNLIGKNCTPFGSDQRLEIEKLNSYLFPDLSVVCGDVNFTDDSLPAIINPILIIEVLSPSTESFDRGRKFQLYRQIPSLQEYVLVSQDSVRIERYYLKTANMWEFTEAVGSESNITLKSIDCTLALADIYANVVLAESNPIE